MRMTYEDASAIAALPFNPTDGAEKLDEIVVCMKTASGRRSSGRGLPTSRSNPSVHSQNADSLGSIQRSEG